MYEFNWGFTKAQIDLMNIDAPYTCYEAAKEDRTSGGSKEPPSREKMEETVRKWEERKKTRKFNLETFLGKGVLPKEPQKSE